MAKNLLFVFADQWRRAAMGCAKEDPVITPNMDAFAEESVYCNNATSSFPLCSPHRASLFTGRNLQSTGVFTNCKTGLSMRLKDSEPCIAEVLRLKGYQTGYIGKWHLDEPEQNNSETPASGASAWDAYTPPGIRRHGFEFWHSYGACDKHLTPHYWENSEKAIEINEWSPKHETDVAIDYIENRDKEKPFCLFVSWNPPHSPYDTVPEEYLDLYKDKALPFRENVCLDNIHHHTFEPLNYTEAELRAVQKGYFAAVSGLDDQFGRLIKALKEMGIDKDTIVVLSADHGDMLGSHALMAKHVWYEESIGIPFVIGGAGMGHGECGTVFGSADIAPTLLDMLGADIPAAMEGKSIAEDIVNCKTDETGVAYLVACPGRDVFLESFAKAGKNPMDFGWRGVRTQRYTYIIDVGYTPEPCLSRLLYDNLNDKYQMHPLTIQSTADNAVAKELEQKLCAFLQTENDGFLQHI
ncbi:MAG: sulfatase [Oscillospiraceae bacterium]